MTATTAQAFPVTGPLNLIVRLGHGSLRVTTSDNLSEATVRLTARVPDSDVLDRIAVEMRGDTLAVVAPRQGGIADLIGGWRRDRDSVDAEIEVPTGTAVKLTTATADITITGRCGRADIATGSAGVTIDAVVGDLRLRYGSAASRVQTVTGDATVRSGSGAARFGEVGGTLQAGFGSGDLSVDVARGAVRSRTGSGDVRIAAVYGDCDVASGAGQVSIGLPVGLSAKLDVTTGTGRLDSELPIEERRAGTKCITVRARTGSGDIRLFRAA